VVRVADHIANTILRRAGVSAEVIALEMPDPQPRIPESVEVPFHGETSRVLQYAAEEAERLQGMLLGDYVLADDHIGPEHLLLGLLREGESVAASVLARHGVTIAVARDEVLRRSR
jgi:ATP-dependent Clp protease ATP-binding subunit ClpC